MLLKKMLLLKALALIDFTSVGKKQACANLFPALQLYSFAHAICFLAVVNQTSGELALTPPTNYIIIKANL